MTLSAAAGQSYLWNTGDTTQSIAASQSGSYYAIVTTSNGCSDTTATYTTTLFADPDISVSASGALGFCDGSSVTLTAAAGQSYLWSTGATSQSITASQSGSYYAIVTTANGCVDTTATYTTTLFAGVNGTQIYGSASVTPSSSETYATTQNPNNSYAWQVNGGAIMSGQGTNAIVILWGSGASGDIMVLESNSLASFCSNSDTLIVNISGVGLDDNSLKSVVLSPNPNSGYFSIKVDQQYIGSAYRVVDFLGRIIEVGTITKPSQNFDLSDKPKGVYRIEVSNEKASKTLNVVIQ